MYKTIIIAALTIFITLLSIYAQEDVIIKGKQNESLLPLGFIEFKPHLGESKKLPLEPGNIIAKDLDFSGRVKILKVPNKDSITRNYLLLNKAYAYVSGSYLYQGNKVILNCYLIDTETQDLIIGKKYSVKNTQLRLAAHKFSDELVYQLFGEQGIAQTKIVFVSKQS